MAALGTLKSTFSIMIFVSNGTDINLYTLLCKLL